MDQLFEQTSDESYKAARRNHRQVGRRILLAVLIFISLTLLIAWLLWQAEPRHWQQSQARIQSIPPKSLDQQAIETEQIYLAFVSNNTHDAKPRRLSLSFDQINAWLSTRMDMWLAHQDISLPDSIQKPTVTSDGQQLLLAFNMVGPDIDQIFTLRFQLSPDTNGQLQARCTGIYGGNLPIPTFAIEKLLVKNSHGKAAGQLNSLLPWLEGQSINLFNNRNTKLQSLSISEQGIEMTATSR